MSDRTLADEVADILQGAEVELAEAFHADRYELVTIERQPRRYGGWVEREVVVEQGRCAIGQLSDGRLNELTRLGRLSAVTAYRVELRRDTLADDAMAIRVNGTRYTVIDVTRPGRQELFVTLVVEELIEPVEEAP